MVGSVVLDQKDFALKVASDKPFQVDEIGLSIEDLLEMVEETARIQLDGAKDFQGLFLTGGGDFGLPSYPGRCLVKGGVLPERSFVFEEEGSPLTFGFFLMSG